MKDTIHTSLDLPRELHRRLHERAARLGCSARRLILESIERAVAEPIGARPRRRLSLDVPIVASRGRPFDLTSDEIHELIQLR